MSYLEGKIKELERKLRADEEKVEDAKKEFDKKTKDKSDAEAAFNRAHEELTRHTQEHAKTRLLLDNAMKEMEKEKEKAKERA